ncbi:hypothetical protein IV203_021418 [Nitzschia inconspicua]|uniref:Uncharacterized protein n=1 Tax=Nitzschia inconspicua TaxID=303405 RepID=A0A9K3KIJ0_9STRA|nr:hypothetical protein IV203_021418 [Nitzschia inconspicua]
MMQRQYSATIALFLWGAAETLSCVEATTFLRNSRGLQSLTNQTQDFVSGPQVNQDREVDFDYCYGALGRHDTNGNQRVDQLEYLAFVQDFGSNTECLGNLRSLPLEIMACWNQLSCECRFRGGAADCCEGNNAHIPITGLSAEEDGSGSEPFVVEEQQFLRQTCLRTDQCVIAFCGVPPPPVIPPPPPIVPPVAPVPAAAASRTYWELFALLALLLCCCRRRWCFFAGAKHQDEEDESSSESEEELEGGGMKHVVTEEEGEELGSVPPAAAAVPAALAGDYADPDANRQVLKATEEDEEGMGGGVMYSRSVQEPEWEEDPVPPGPKAIEQYDPPPPPAEDFQLKHIEKEPPPPPEEDPYALEHYVPDGGIVEHERTGKWGYDADGGWTPEERAGKDPSEWNRAGYDREEHVSPEVVDNRKKRHLEAMGGGAIFDHLDEDEHLDTNAAPSGGLGDMFSWVISSTLSTLDQKQDDLRSSGHSRRSEESK